MHPLHRTWRVRGIPAESDEAWLLNFLQNHEDLQVDQEHRRLLQAFQENSSLQVLCTHPDLLDALQNPELLQTFQAHPYLLQILHDYPDLLQVLRTPSGLEILGTHPYLLQVLKDHVDLLQILQNPPDIHILETNPDNLHLLQEHPDLLKVLKQHPYVLPTLREHPHLLKIANDAAANGNAPNDNNINNGAEVYTLASGSNGCKIATVRFQCLPAKLNAIKQGTCLTIQTPYESTGSLKRKRGAEIMIDDNFDGVTILHSPSPQDHEIDILALSGLGSHPFGSFKNKDNGHMWLCNSLPRDLPDARVMIYGCDSTLLHSHSFAGLVSYGSFLYSPLTELLHSPTAKPLLLLGHSLGGLMIKEALIQIDGSEPELLQSIRGLFFFGVPNNGLNIESLAPLVQDQPNRPFLDSLGHNSEGLGRQRQKFPEVLRKSNMEMFCFYETLESPTAPKDMVAGHLAMTGPPACLVDIPSATNFLPPQYLGRNAFAFPRTHSDLVKFKSQDSDYQTVLGCFRKIITNLTNEKLTEMHTHQELSNNMEAPALTADERKKLLSSLDFETIDIRHQTIKNAQIKTCEWFMKTPEYRHWRDSKKPGEHSGFLWIKGKPGAGKSTLMKFITNRAKSTMRNNTIIRFFFNARGKDDLEKSTEGMYRSILLQLLRKAPALQSVFDSLQLVSSDIEKHRWNIEALETLFREAVKQFQGPPIFCFVDALDECDDMQIRKMLSFFEQTGEVANSDRVKFHVCFSSRHYPNISIKNGIELVLEDKPGHSEDIRNYLESELKIGHDTFAEEIRQEAEKKASGIFMWIVLVVDILNMEFDAGCRLALKERLHEIPGDLHDLFRNILVRDTKHKESLLLCIQWTLFAKDALTPKELYFAIHSDAAMDDLSEWIEEISEEDVKRYILDSSKGLVELVKSKTQTVQFIHESVRDFFLKENGLKEIWPEGDVNFQGKSHERLKQCCLNEMNIMRNRSREKNDTRYREEPDQSLPSIKNASPFSRYAVENIFFHADAAQMYGVNQLQFLKNLPLPDWIRWKKTVTNAKTVRYTEDASLLYILAVHDSANLIKICPSNRDWLVIGTQYHGPPVIAALFYRSFKAVKALLEVQSKTYLSTSPLHDLWTKYSQNSSKRKNLHRGHKFDAKGVFCYIIQHNDPILAEYVFATGDYNDTSAQLSNALTMAAENGQETNVRKLLEKGADINARGPNTNTALIGAALKGHDTTVRLLLEKGANIEATYEHGRTALIEAASNGHDTTVRLLLEKGADINARQSNDRTALIEAAYNEQDTTMQLLLEKGADINARQSNDRTALIEAACYGHDTIVRLLLEKGADINARQYNGRTALIEAACYGHDTIVRLLLEKGANIEATYEHGRTALIEAASNGHDTTVRLLLEKGADINARQSNDRTALIEAACYGHDTIVRLLLEKGADINARQSNGRTALIEAASNGHDTIVRLLLEKGADINACQSNGWTALIGAACYGHDTTVRLLLEKGADIEATDEYGRTALWYCDKKGDENMAQLLRNSAALRDKRLETSGTASHFRPWE